MALLRHHYVPDRTPSNFIINSNEQKSPFWKTLWADCCPSNLHPDLQGQQNSNWTQWVTNLQSNLALLLENLPREQNEQATAEKDPRLRIFTEGTCGPSVDPRQPDLGDLLTPTADFAEGLGRATFILEG